MRLHLIIQRNGLPPTQILWTVPNLPPPPSTTTTTTQPRITSSSSSNSHNNNATDTNAPPLSSSSLSTTTTTASSVNASNGGGPSTTIAQLLEHVNEVIPLESADWGLEDYAVEVGGFECLHFAEVGGWGGVLREGDVVCIRPLQTSDIRSRKFSGRHQISADGKHLIDGVAFGRGLLKRGGGGRPAVRIEARKRRRVLVDEEEERGEVEVGERQVIVRAGFEDADQDGEEDDEDGEWGGLEDEEERWELEEEDFRDSEAGRGRSYRGAGLGLNFLNGGGYSNPLLDQYSQDEPAAGTSAGARKKSSSKKPKSALSSQPVTRTSSTGSNKSVRFEEEAESTATTPATEIAVEDDDEDDEDDEDFDPDELDDSTDNDESDEDSIDESDKENTEPLEDTIRNVDTSDSSSSSGSDTSEADIDDDETSSSGTSSSDSDSDSEPDSSKPSTTVQKRTVVNGRSSSSSSTSDGNANLNGNSTPSNNKTSEDPATKAKNEPATRPPVPPGAGKQSTHNRNARRKAETAMRFHKAKGEISNDATLEDLLKFKELTSDPPLWVRKLRESLDWKQAQSEERGQDTSPIITRRQKLLDSLRSEGGIDINSQIESTGTLVPAHSTGAGDEAEKGEKKSKKKAKAAKKEAQTSQDESTLNQSQNEEQIDVAAVSQTNEESLESGTVQVPRSLPESNLSSTNSATVLGASQSIDTPEIALTPPDPSASPGSAPSGSLRPRSKLDLASSKRLLFGSLGLRAPKNKDDESALREKLMKDIKPLKPVKERVAEIEAAEENSTPLENDDDSWREKVHVTAVECCHEGIEYSAPPFPFVQRWDPQQQGTYPKGKAKENRKRKRKNRKRLEESFDEQFESSLEPGSPSKIARQESYDANTEVPQFYSASFEQEYTQKSQAWPHDQNLEDSAAANEQLLRESSECAAYNAAHSEEEVEIEELRNLPPFSDNLTAYPELTKEKCSAGTVITFKRFLMSAETNWQPGISGFLTAVVRELYENGILLMTLAKRDQPKDEAQYDEETGERVYGKFEMPGYDDENGGNDKSRLEMPFDELISPHLIRAAAGKDCGGIGEDRPLTASDPDDTLVGDEAQRAGTEPQATASFDSSMNHPPNSEAEISMPFESAPRNGTDAAQESPLDARNAPDGGEDSHVYGIANSFEPKDRQDKDSRPTQTVAFIADGSNPPTNGTNSALSPVPSNAQASQTVCTPEEAFEHSDANKDPSSHTTIIEHPTLPESLEESGSVQNQRQHRSVSLNSEARATSPDFVSPPPTRRGKEQSKAFSTPALQSQKSAETDKKPAGTFDGANDSLDEFPELFSRAFQARMSQGPPAKAESPTESHSHQLPEATRRTRSSKKAITESASEKNGLVGIEEVYNSDDKSSIPLSQSEVPQSSQIVDLTMSSDPADSQYEQTGNSSSYQSSSGWVDKPNASLDLPVAKRTTKRKTRSRATMAY